MAWCSQSNQAALAKHSRASHRVLAIAAAGICSKRRMQLFSSELALQGCLQAD